MSSDHTNGQNIPTRVQSVKFAAKSRVLQFRRWLEDAAGRKVRRFVRGTDLVNARPIGESKTKLWTESDAAERFLVAGKIQNLRVAIRELNCVEVPAGETFSFWKQVGRASRSRGFVAGRELREGCIIPNVGGGLCQLSNALYDAALKANFDIVERHAHTQVISGSLAEKGRDATVFWNYVDLRFRSPEAFRIEAELSGDHLAVTIRGKKIDRPAKLTRGFVAVSDLNSCASCGMDDCFRVIEPSEDLDFGKTAFLVDEYSPEFDDYISSIKDGRDELFLPMNGKRFRRANYAWNIAGFGRVSQSLLTTAIRSYRSRRLAAQGAARQRGLLETYERLAADYSKKLTFDALHVVVDQNLLPFLWKSGALGGRTFDVLMTAMPIAELQTRLDAAAALHPESKTLSDFRADDQLLDTEMRALAAARKIITPHTDIASLFGQRAVLIPWKRPVTERSKTTVNANLTVVFPASTVGRKGCYELRNALRGLNIKLLTMGPMIEAGGFWDGFDVSPAGDDWLEAADLVVLAAFVEHRPRRLIRAAAAGVPVIASTACGVSNIDDIVFVKAGDAAGLRAEIVKLLNI